MNFEPLNDAGKDRLPGLLSIRMTQVWDATVTARETGKTIAVFRCTQMVLYPRTGAGS